MPYWTWRRAKSLAPRIRRSGPIFSVFVLRTPSKREDFIENGWAGGALAIGSQVCLNVTGPCPRCVMTTLPQGDLPQDLGILKTAVRHNKGAVGTYASVAKVGSTRRGDSVTFEPASSAVAV